MAREVQQDLGPAERLQPAATATNSFVQPSRDPGMVNQALKALGALQPGLAKIADKMSADERAKQEALAERKIGGMTYEESQAAVKAGKLQEFASPWFRAAFEKQHGMRMANEARRAAEDELATADMSEANPEDFIAKYVAKDNGVIDASGSRFLAAGYTQGLAGLTDKVRDKVNADRIQRTVEVRSDNAYQNFLGDFELAGEEMADEGSVLSLLRGRYKTNRDALGLSYRDQDKIIGEVLKTVAQRPGMEAVVAAAGKMDRGDGIALSAKLGASFEALKSSAEASTMRRQTEDAQGELADYIQAADKGELDVERYNLFVSANRKIISGSFEASLLGRNEDAQRRIAAAALVELQKGAKEAYLTHAAPEMINLARQGKVAEISDLRGNVYGKDVEVTQEEARKYALKGASDAIEKDGLAQGRSPAEVRREQIAMYGSNGEIDPVAQSRVQAALRAAYAPGDVPQTVLDYLPEIQAIQDTAPHMIDLIASSKEDRLFLNSIGTALDLGFQPAQAIKEATWRRDNADRIAMPSPKDSRKMVDTAFARWQDLNDGWLVVISPGAKRLTSRNLIDPIIRERVEFYAATGASGKKLDDLVYQSIQRTHTYFNGQLIDVSGTGQPAQFALPVLADAAAALAEAKPSYKAKGLTFVPSAPGSATFRAVTTTGIPIPGTDRTWREMSDLYQQRRTARLGRRAVVAKTQRELDVERWTGENAGAGAPGSMIEPIR